MKKIDASSYDFQALNEELRNADGEDIVIDNCLGQRFIGSGRSSGNITINGVPGNALGAYLNGADIIVKGNAQDAVGDTMNEGSIVVHGSSGDATGYAMRGGKILVRDDAGYRAGIHIKAYKEKLPVIVIGGRAGSFLGEYQAGGIIIVLGLSDCASCTSYDTPIVGYFCGTGMHGGKIYLRCDELPSDLPPQVSASVATADDIATIRPYIDEYSDAFGADAAKIINANFFVLSPNGNNPYKRLYMPNS